ncbi:MAG: methionyl-tRNA formyltransferase [Parachlamydiales bacterium]|jgi:methionyl-tRNA formyltransferase
MKIIFFGTPKFSSNILAYLFEKKFDIQAVVTQPDHIRNNKVEISEVKKLSKNYLSDENIFQPEKASDPDFIDLLKKYKADLFVVIAYGQILTQELLDLPLLAPVNVHASLLPKYRGAAPMQHCLINGDKKTGITIMRMVRKMDAGPIIDKDEIEIDDDMNFSVLEDKLCSIAKPLLLRVIERFKNKNITYQMQDENQVTFAPKITKELREVNFKNTSEVINNQIRAFADRPGAFCKISLDEEIKELKIFKIKIMDINLAPKEILIQNNTITIGSQDKAIQLIEVQLEGKKRMSASEFVHGLKNNLIII